MVSYVPDRTGRFARRPYWLEGELDRECERIVTAFLLGLRGKVEFPIGTDDLKTLIEGEARSLDAYADLSGYGPDVEGVTVFEPGRKPAVMVASRLAEDESRENRLRTTLAHEYGHVHFHAYLLDAEPRAADLFEPKRAEPQVISCKRDRIVDAPRGDWMEWQAGYVCGAILMPVSAVRGVVAAVQERRGLYGATTPVSTDGRLMVQAVAKEFQVSMEAARVRLSRLNHLSDQPVASAASSLFATR